MPSAVIDVCRAYTPDEEVRLMDAVHAALVQAFRVPATHRNVTLVVHAPHRMAGRTDSPAPDRVTHVTLFVLPGRSLDAKRALYRAIVDGFAPLGIPPACVLIRLHELPPENVGVRGGLPVCDIELGYRLDV